MGRRRAARSGPGRTSPGIASRSRRSKREPRGLPDAVCQGEQRVAALGSSLAEQEQESYRERERERESRFHVRKRTCCPKPLGSAGEPGLSGGGCEKASAIHSTAPCRQPWPAVGTLPQIRGALFEEHARAAIGAVADSGMAWPPQPSAVRRLARGGAAFFELPAAGPNDLDHTDLVTQRFMAFLSPTALPQGAGRRAAARGSRRSDRRRHLDGDRLRDRPRAGRDAAGAGTGDRRLRAGAFGIKPQESADIGSESTA